MASDEDMARLDRELAVFAEEYGVKLSRVTIYAWARRLLGRFSLAPVLVAMETYGDWFHGKAPNAGDLLLIAGCAEKWGPHATRLASRSWMDGITPGDPVVNMAGPTPVRMRQAVEAMHRQVGNPDIPMAGELEPAKGEQALPLDADDVSGLVAQLVDSLGAGEPEVAEQYRPRKREGATK